MNDIYIGLYQVKEEKVNLYYNKAANEFYYINPTTLEKINLENKEEIKILKSWYQFREEEELKEAIRIKKARKADMRQILKELLFEANAILLLFSPFLIIKLNSAIDYMKNVTVERLLDEEYKNEIWKKFQEAIDENNTLTSSVKEYLYNDLHALTNKDITLLNFKVESISNRLRIYNFSNIDEENYPKTLSLLLFGNDDILSRCIALQLHEYANHLKPSIMSVQFGWLTLNLDESFLSEYFIIDKLGANSSIAKSYNTSSKEIRKSLEHLDSSIYELSYQEQMKKIILSYYLEKGNLDTLDRLVLISEIFDGNYHIYHNLFEENIVVTYTDENYGTVQYHIDKKDRCDVSMPFYQEKLTKLIEEKGNSLDYKDPDSRFLIYLFLLSYKADKSLLLCSSAEELSNQFIRTIFENGENNAEFLYAYFTSGEINTDLLICECRRVPRDDEFFVALYVEYIKCLKEEENLDIESLKKRVEYLLKYEEKENIYLADIFKKALKNDESLFREFSMAPVTYFYKKEEVKKHILENN